MLYGVKSFATFAALAVLAEVFSTATAIGSVAPCSQKSPKPYEWSVIRKGDLELIGLRVPSFAAYAVRGGKWTRIRLQIDEINAEGDFVLDGGLPYTKATDDGYFDANDELVVSGKELGDDFLVTEVPTAYFSGVKRALKFKLCMGDTFFGAALIVGGNSVNSLMWNPMVSLNVNQLEVVSPGYRYNFRKDNPALLGEVFLRHPNGREDAVFASSDFQMVLRLPWFLPDFTLTNEDFTSMIESWQSGPLRTIVAVGVKFRKFLSVFNFHLFSELVFYEDLFQIPTIIEFPFDAYEHLRPGSGIAYALSFPKGKKWPVKTNLKLLPEQTPEQVLASGQTANFTDQFYAVANRPEGAVKVMVRVGENARKMVPPPFYVEPDQFGPSQWSKYWDWLLDMEGDLGVFLDISRVHKGRYDFGLDLLLSHKADETFNDYGQPHVDWTTVTIPK